MKRVLLDIKIQIFCLCRQPTYSNDFPNHCASIPSHVFTDVKSDYVCQSCLS